MMTPDSSPHNTRWSTHYSPSSLFPVHSPIFKSGSASEASTSAVKLEPPTSNQATTLAPAPSVSPASSYLSSPFVPGMPIPGKKTLRHRSTSPMGSGIRIDSPMDCNHMSQQRRGMDLSSLEPAAEIMPTEVGGEMERIRQVMFQNQLAQRKEAENRRPDYLKREKRADIHTDFVAADRHENERSSVIGIIDSPSKGRRLTLFQETSEESFEESLMAGGYGRYRTTEWVRQPQPLALATTSVTGPSKVVALLEQTQEAPAVSDKEFKKRKRLEAFRGERGFSVQRSNLLAMELQGRGRVLIDPTCETKATPSNNPSPTKKRTGGRRKKKSSGLKMREERNPIPPTSKEIEQRPNWIDHEFPWRLRTEEVAGVKKIEDENRLRLIKKFLDRDSDLEDSDSDNGNNNDDNESHPVQFDGIQKEPTRMGRGKMISLPANTDSWCGSRMSSLDKKTTIPYDPADARTALLAKKSVRALSYRLQRKQHATDDDEVVCICNGADNGRQLVQCDGCEAWYHLYCIGIKSIDELGREEDPWFCHSCKNRSSSEPEVLSSEPTFVPTDDEPQTHRIYDTPFFQPSSPHNSPSWSFERGPRTPTHRASDLEPPSLSSGSSWIDSSRHGPSTPHNPSQGVRVYGHNSDTYNRPFDESPFDPTSTPSRGIKFGVPFMTPKNNVWSARPPGVIQTPSKPSGHGPSSSHGGLTSALDNSQRSGGFDFSPFGRFPPFGESPIRRSRSGEESRRFPDSPLASRSHQALPLEESPVIRVKGKEKL
ncbi:hypothetical protein AX15_005764 [Amanita polypyramis BW_CC]|nr:hypothetical protein AX15_005764 [Amanita polypyramis BW_CC]